jgi:hypothetical protein
VAALDAEVEGCGLGWVVGGVLSNSLKQRLALEGRAKSNLMAVVKWRRSKVSRGMITLLLIVITIIYLNRSYLDIRRRVVDKFVRKVLVFADLFGGFRRLF